MDSVTVRGLQIAYDRAGSGPPLVLLHGYVGDGPSTFGPQIDDLSRDFTVVAWDAPGAGGSDDPPEDLGMGGYVDLLADFLAVIGIGRAHIGGLSIGGSLAIAFAERHPDRTRSLILLSAYAGWAGSLSAEESTRRLEQAFALSRLAPQAFVETLLPSMFRADVPETVRAAFAASLAAFHPAGLRALATASAADLRAGLSSIDVPTLLVYGDADIRAPHRVAEDLAAALRGSRLVFIPRAGHLITLEEPAVVNREIRDFLATA